MMVLLVQVSAEYPAEGWREVSRVRVMLLLNGLMSVGYTIIDVLV